MKGFVFDLDNTLFDRYATITKIIELNFDKIRAHINPSYDAQKCARHLCDIERLYIHSYGWVGIFEALCKTHFFNIDNIPDMQRSFAFFVDNFAKTAVAYPYTRDVLTAIRNKGYKTAMITNGHEQLQNGKIALIGIADLFDLILPSDTYAKLAGFEDAKECQKPNTYMFDYVAKQLGVCASELYYVGDSPPNDAVASAKAGYVPVWIRSQSPWSEENKFIPKLCYDTIEGLYELI